MNIPEIFLIASMILDGLLGVMVFLNHPRRPVNRLYLAMSICILAWLGNNWVTLHTHDETVALWTIRLASLFAACVPTAMQLLRMAIKYSAEGLMAILRRARPLLLLNVAIALLSLTDALLPAVSFPSAANVAEPHYGPGFLVYTLYFLGSALMLAILFARDWKRLQGADRVELEFVILGSAAALLIGSVFSPLLALLTGTSRYVPVANAISIVTLTGCIAYGIAAHRVLDMATFIRRAIAYILLAAYLAAVYLVIWCLTDYVGRSMPAAYHVITHLLPALVVAFSMTSAHGILQRFADRLFINPGALDVGRTLQRASVLLQTVTTLDDLLQRFTQLVSEVLGVDRALLLTAQNGKFASAIAEQASAPEFDASAPLIRALADRSEPVVADLLLRARAYEPLQQVVAQMRQNKIAMAVGVKSKGALEAVLLLGPRLSGRVFSAAEQDALQLICNQLAVALENARLYTQVQDGKIYNDILLDRLVSGVIAVDAAGLVSVFNREAQRVTRLTASEVLRRPCQGLPPPLARALITLLAPNAPPLGSTELILALGGETVTLRAGGAAFKGHAGKVLGALLVFSDITDLKKMEIQIRRSDRLASLGTLSAGMAHEIKNPLVTLKTFAQLLPERYADRDFRDTFSSLVGQEIHRIDSIVNQLLEFSRPAKPQLVPVALHHVLEQSLKLVAEEMRKHHITLVSLCGAPRDRILADSHQLSQVFLNLFLNAIQAMPKGGQLTVSTRLTGFGGLEVGERPEPLLSEQIDVGIADTGQGIPPESLARIFDPFFTTKNEGTGLGLSVVHGIIEEHGGWIDVRSTVDKGSTFHIFFPLVPEKVRNEAST